MKAKHVDEMLTGSAIGLSVIGVALGGAPGAALLALAWPPLVAYAYRVNTAVKKGK